VGRGATRPTSSGNHQFQALLLFSFLCRRTFVNHWQSFLLRTRANRLDIKIILGHQEGRRLLLRFGRPLPDLRFSWQAERQNTLFGAVRHGSNSFTHKRSIKTWWKNSAALVFFVMAIKISSRTRETRMRWVYHPPVSRFSLNAPFVSLSVFSRLGVRPLFSYQGLRADCPYDLGAPGVLRPTFCIGQQFPTSCEHRVHTFTIGVMNWQGKPYGRGGPGATNGKPHRKMLKFTLAFARYNKDLNIFKTQAASRTALASHKPGDDPKRTAGSVKIFTGIFAHDVMFRTPHVCAYFGALVESQSASSTMILNWATLGLARFPFVGSIG